MSEESEIKDVVELSDKLYRQRANKTMHHLDGHIKQLEWANTYSSDVVKDLCKVFGRDALVFEDCEEALGKFFDSVFNLKARIKSLQNEASKFNKIIHADRDDYSREIYGEDGLEKLADKRGTLSDNSGYYYREEVEV